MIDVYTCPARSNSDGCGELPLDYMVAIMSAAKAGAPVQVCYYGDVHIHQCWLSGQPIRWDWVTYSYRIDPASRPAAIKAGDWVMSRTYSTGNKPLPYLVERVEHDYNHVIIGGYAYVMKDFRLATPDELAALTPFKPGDWVVHAHGGPVNQVDRCDRSTLYLKGVTFDHNPLFFRLARPDELIAPGHNPDKLTIEQVGEGWRLLDEDEIKRRQTTISIQYWDSLHAFWSGLSQEGRDANLTYRTKLSRAELAALDAPTSDQIRSNLLAQAAAQGWVVGNVIYGNQVITAVTAWVLGDMLGSHSVNVDEERAKGKPFVFVHYAPHFVQPLCGLRDAIPRSPIKTKRVPMRQEDWPAVIWIRHSNSPISLVTVMNVLGFTTSSGWSISFYDLSLGDHYQYSSDRITWHPCYREVPV